MFSRFARAGRMMYNAKNEYDKLYKQDNKKFANTFGKLDVEKTESEEQKELINLHEQVNKCTIEASDFLENSYNWVDNTRQKVDNMNSFNSFFNKMMMLECARPFLENNPNKSKYHALGQSMGRFAGMCLFSKSFRQECKDTVLDKYYEHLKVKASLKPNSKYSKKIEEFEKKKNGGRLPFTEESAAIAQIGLKNKAYKDLRDPSLDPEEVKLKYFESVKILEAMASYDGCDLDKVRQRARVIDEKLYGSAGKYKNREMMYGDVRSDYKPKVAKLYRDKNGNIKSRYVWDGQYYKENGEVYDDFFHPREPLSDSQHMNMHSNDVGIFMMRAKDEDQFNETLMKAMYAKICVDEKRGFPQAFKDDPEFNLYVDNYRMMKDDLGEKASDVYGNSLMVSLQNFEKIDPSMAGKWADKYKDDFVSNFAKYAEKNDEKAYEEPFDDFKDYSQYDDYEADFDYGDYYEDLNNYYEKSYKDGNIDKDRFETLKKRTEDFKADFGFDNKDKNLISPLWVVAYDIDMADELADISYTQKYINENPLKRDLKPNSEDFKNYNKAKAKKVRESVEFDEDLSSAKNIYNRVASNPVKGRLQGLSKKILENGKAFKDTLSSMYTKEDTYTGINVDDNEPIAKEDFLRNMKMFMKGKNFKSDFASKYMQSVAMKLDNIKGEYMKSSSIKQSLKNIMPEDMRDSFINASVFDKTMRQRLDNVDFRFTRENFSKFIDNIKSVSSPSELKECFSKNKGANSTSKLMDALKLSPEKKEMFNHIAKNFYINNSDCVSLKREAMQKDFIQREMAEPPMKTAPEMSEEDIIKSDSIRLYNIEKSRGVSRSIKEYEDIIRFKMDYEKSTGDSIDDVLFKENASRLNDGRELVTIFDVYDEYNSSKDKELEL